MNERVVIDASLAVKLLVPERDSHSALALAESWERAGTQPTGPRLLFVEVANALRTKVRAGEVTMDVAVSALEMVLPAAVQVREVYGLPGKALRLAHELQIDGVYDVYYLALAEALGCQLWTADDRFVRSLRGLRGDVRLLGQV